MKHEAISDRREVVKMLYGLGLSYQEVANALNDSVSAIINDVKKLGGADAFPGHVSVQTPEIKTLNFQAALVAYIELRPSRKKCPLGAQALGRYLGIREAEIFACGIATAMNVLLRPQYPPERRSYHILLRAIFGDRAGAWESDIPVHPNDGVLLDYLEAVRDKKVPLPTREDFGSEIAKFLVANDRPYIAPIWEGDEMYREIDRWITLSLTERQATVIQMRFAIGYDRMHKFDEIGMRYDLARERIRQIEAKALRDLRENVDASKFGRYIWCREYETAGS